MALSNNNNNGNDKDKDSQAIPSQSPLRDRSASVSLQTTIPTPVSVQIYNLFSGQIHTGVASSGGDGKMATRLEYSTQLLRPVQAELVQVFSSSAATTGNTSKDKVLYTFDATPPSSCDTATTSPCWSHLAEALDWESLDRAVFERIHLRLRIICGDENGGGDDESKTYFLQCPLHPSKLVPLQKKLPKNRPINTVLVQFSDESYRIPPHILEQFNEGASLARTEHQRFAEDAFTALDSVNNSSSSVNAATSLLDAAHAELEEETALSTLAIHATSTEVSVEVLPSPGTAEQRLAQDTSHLPAAETQARMAQLLVMRDAWRDRVQVAQNAMQAAQAAWEADEGALKETLQRLRVYQSQEEQIRQATQQEEQECQRLELHLEAQRIRLVKELRRIYPVIEQLQQPTAKGIWKIRGLPLPRDLFSIPDEDLSAALGLLCHAVTLLSRYLHVPLRYRLYCNSSRSAVQDDRGTVFPLFQARPVEREQVEYGVVLLERNIECIGISRGIHWAKESTHILEKIHLIYDTVIEGDFASR